MDCELREAHATMDRTLNHVGQLARNIVSQYAPGHPVPEFALAALVPAVEAWTAAQTEYWTLVREACA